VTAPLGLRTRLPAQSLQRQRTILGAYGIAFSIFVVITVFRPNFASAGQIRFLLVTASFTGLAALGQTFVVLGGGADLSIPYTINTVATLLTFFAHAHDGPLVWVVPLVLAIAVCIGLINGFGVALLGISPIIMTLGVNTILQGGLFVYVGSTPTDATPPFFRHLAINRVGPVPIDTLVWLGITALATVVLTYSTFGRRLYAVGTNRVVAELAGVHVRRVLVSTYVISSLAAAACGMMLVGFVGQSYYGLGDEFLFASVAAVAIGGAPLLGGSGHYLGTVAGALVLTVIAGLLPILNLQHGWLQIIYGLTILVAVSLASIRRSTTS